MAGDILGYYCAGPYQGMGADGNPADDGGVGPDAGSLLDPGSDVVAGGVPGIGAAGRLDIGKDHAGATEDIVFQDNPLVDADIVLDLDIVADLNVGGDKDVLSDFAVRSDFRPGHDMAKMPDLGARTDLCRLVHICRLVNKVFPILLPFSFIHVFCPH